MSATKSFLKSARLAISSNDPDQAVYLCDSVIDDQDPENFMAHLLKGKALQILGKNEKALAAYQKSHEIEPENITPLKGILSIVREKEDYELFFDVLTKMVTLDASQMNLQHISQEARKYRSKFARKISTLEETYLRHMLPGDKLGDAIGELTQPLVDTLKSLVKIVASRELDSRTADLRKARMKIPANPSVVDLEKLDLAAWKHYETSDLANLYERLISVLDDKRREDVEQDLFNYKFEMLKVAPPNKKKEIRQQVFDMASGLVTVKRKLPLAYKVYFDWSDYQAVGDIDFLEVMDLVSMTTTGWPGVLFAFVQSERSPFPLERVNRYFEEHTKNTKKHKRKNAKKSKAKESGGADSELSVEDIAPFMARAKSGDSIIALRIAIGYYIEQKEYELALDSTHAAMKLLSESRRSTGLDLSHSRTDILLSLATIYTYHESPKNFGKALQIFDSVLKQDSENSRAKIGKALVILERGQYTEAFALLEEVIVHFPNNLQALMAKSWAQVKLGDYSEGRKGLTFIMTKTQEAGTTDVDLKATVLYRLGESYLMEVSSNQDADPATVSEYIKLAKSHLISSLKQSSTFSSPYTSLGRLYLEFLNDENRAIRCYYKAFELDAGETEAAKKIVSIFSEKMEWDMVKIVCERVLSSERTRHLLPTDEDPSWPYRALGCSCLENQDDVGAIEHFQNGLRLAPADVSSWIGLGEAYFARGRIEASAKVFGKALELDPESWQSSYMLAIVQSAVGEFDSSIEHLESFLGKHPDNMAALIGYIQILISKSQLDISGGFTGRAISSNVSAVKLLHSAFKVDPSSQRLWGLVGDCIRIFTQLQSHLVEAPLREIYNIIRDDSSLDNDSPSDLCLINYLQSQSSSSVEFTVALSIYAARRALSYLSPNSPKLLRSSLFFNMGLAYSDAFYILEDDTPIFLGTDSLTDRSIKALNKAINNEPNNADYWTALGNISLTKNARVVQHCFIKAATLSPRDPSIWTNLALLSLFYGDLSFAKEAFARAQSIAPENGTSWTGNALLAEVSGNTELSKKLYTHAMVLSNGRTPLSMLLYGLSVAKGVVSADSKNSVLVQEINFASFAMISYLKYYPQDRLALSITTMILERVKDYERGIDLGKQLCEVLEIEYTKSENDTTLENFAEAKALLARLYLGAGNYELAIEEAEASLGVAEAAQVELPKVVLTAHSVLGLSLFFTSRFVESLEQFRLCLNLSKDSSQIVVLISQILCALDEEETKQAAMDELFQNIENNGTSLLVIMTLAAISVIENYEDYMVAIKEELETLPLQLLIDDKGRHVPMLVSEINKRFNQHENHLQKFAFFFPSDVTVWTNLDASMASSTASGSISLGSAELSKVLIKTGYLRQIQRGIFLNPQSSTGYKALRGCI
ncbi:unnamed protein product [Kuraishia capsulata CBS 1993]|uniref:Superkiller protein 3 n=1 Tax=Kuraishia capsulata CBS 1993 TaxID=1382522 RepID=W6MIJ0_9ASCO|nr:uncharacterized protein KUCA_T00002260001 [Kuraishia capsulata CBS 1993]CDK26289.1 unnamed protein product [Kuraishia capsulata CBS 1993]